MTLGMRSKIIFILICIGILVTGLVVGLPRALRVSDHYSGRLVFNTEEEYSQFKQEVIDSDASWEGQDFKMNVLSSSPPIIVSFKVSVPQSYNFLYGEKDSQVGTWVFLTILGMVAAMFVTYMGCGFEYDSWFWLFRKE